MLHDRKLFSRIPILKSFSENERLRMQKSTHCRVVSYAKGNLIYIEGQECRTWDLLLAGEVGIHRIDPNGNSMTVGIFTSGDSIGGNLLFSNNPIYPMTVMAKMETKIMHVDKELVLEMCQKNRDFLMRFLNSVSERSLFLTERIKSIAMKTIRELIIDYVTDQCKIQNTTTIVLPVTKKELAEQMGVSRTSLSRELQKMRNEGMIDFQRNQIEIKKKLLERITL